MLQAFALKSLIYLLHNATEAQSSHRAGYLNEPRKTEEHLDQLGKQWIESQERNCFSWTTAAEIFYRQS